MSSDWTSLPYIVNATVQNEACTSLIDFSQDTTYVQGQFLNNTARIDLPNLIFTIKFYLNSSTEDSYLGNITTKRTSEGTNVTFDINRAGTNACEVILSEQELEEITYYWSFGKTIIIANSTSGNVDGLINLLCSEDFEGNWNSLVGTGQIKWISICKASNGEANIDEYYGISYRILEFIESNEGWCHFGLGNIIIMMIYFGSRHNHDLSY